jgi:glycerol kinase
MNTTAAGFVIAIDQGTTSSRSILFDHQYAIHSQAHVELEQFFPHSGWVEQDPDEIWQATLDTARRSMHQVDLRADQLCALGISNQRETTIVWNRASGKPVYNAIVWQDRRTAQYCNQRRQDGAQPMVTAKTGLLLDAYFSASKIAWILDNVSGARGAAERGELAFGTVDSWLIWNLTAGAVHATDVTNASRTMLYNIHRQEWDSELLELFNVPRSMLPEVLDCNGFFGYTSASLLGGKVKICGVAGDQQAAAMGQACFTKGMLKATYGTGCFALLNTGDTAVKSQHQLLTTVASRLDGKISFALEGSIFIAGAAIQWLRDGLRIIESAEQSTAAALASDLDQAVYLVPAFTGLGAPWWDPEARAAIFGLSLATGRNEIVRAALESVCYQTLDLLNAMHADWQTTSDTVLRVDGGMAVNDWTMQFLADILQAPIDRPMITETSALGAAWLAASHAGLWPTCEDFASAWQCQQRFTPSMSPERRKVKVAGWDAAIGRARGRLNG